MAALLLKLLGRKVYTMMDSKFDDRPRTVWREVFKSFFFLPYSGVLTASDRSRDYAHFLGVAPKSIQIGYDTFDSSRLRSYCADPVNVAFQDRPFLIVARLIPKKNIEMALRAFAEAFAVNRSRRLVICGSGPLLDHLVKAAEALQISDLVEFKGFLQTDEICRLMSISLALVLPSTEEQFGQVVAEAQILSLPVMVSLACGARDELVRNAVNGFIFEPDNVEGLSRLMRMLSADEELWKIMSCNSKKMAQKADSGRFAAAIDSFVESERR